MIKKSLNSPVKYSNITPLSLMYSANPLLFFKFKLNGHLTVITTLACGQHGAVQGCAMETGGAEADTSGWVTTRLSQNHNSVTTVEGVSLFHPSETSRHPCALRWCVSNTIKKKELGDIIQNCSFSTVGAHKEPSRDNHVWLNEDESGWWITATGL